jgi:hypothetical protein
MVAGQEHGNPDRNFSVCAKDCFLGYVSPLSYSPFISIAKGYVAAAKRRNRRPDEPVRNPQAERIAGNPMMKSCLFFGFGR